MSKRFSSTILAGLCAIAAGAGCQHAVNVPKVTPPTGASTATPDPYPGAELRGALLSVYYHAWIVENPKPEGSPAPIPLHQAAKILAEDGGPRAASRRRRAIVKLAFYGTKCPAHREAVEILLGPQVSGLQRDLEAEVARAKKSASSELAAEEQVADYLRQPFGALEVASLLGLSRAEEDATTDQRAWYDVTDFYGVQQPLIDAEIQYLNDVLIGLGMADGPHAIDQVRHALYAGSMDPVRIIERVQMALGPIARLLPPMRPR